MKEDLLGEFRQCLEERVDIKEMVRGYRVSVPIHKDDDHLWDLNIQKVDEQSVLISDAGQLALFIEEEDISTYSDTLREVKERLSSKGFDVIRTPEGLEEVTVRTPISEAGCASLDLAEELTRATILLEDRTRAGVPNYGTQLWNNKLEPVQNRIERNREILGIVSVPFYAPDPGIIATPVGSLGKTINKRDVAERQTFPFYRLWKNRPNLEDLYNPIAIVMDSFWSDSQVQTIVTEVADPVLESRIEEFHEMVLGGSESQAF